MKKIIIAIVSACVVATGAFVGVGIWRTTEAYPAFSTAGYVLQGDAGEMKQVAFPANASYAVSTDGSVLLRDTDTGEHATVRQESFVRLDDDSVMALSDGILLDFNDLSDNFINHYYISAGLPIYASGRDYTAETASGTVSFGENLWKLSDTKSLVRADSLTVHFAEGDDREVKEYVQIATTADGIVQLLTPENLWVTISDNCYIETPSATRIYPVTGIVDNGTYKMSLAKLSVSVDDSIVLTEAETRRQIVPELNIETIDGEDGDDGEDGVNGTNGTQGTAGQEGQQGQEG